MIERAIGYFTIKDQTGERHACMQGFTVLNQELVLIGENGEVITVTGDIFAPDDSAKQYFGGWGRLTFVHDFFAVNPDGSSDWLATDNPMLLSVKTAGRI